MRLLDTNVVVYALGRPHRYKRACARLMQVVADGDTDSNVDTELLQEVLYVYASRGQRGIGLSTCSDLLLIFPNPFPITREEIVVAHDLLMRYPIVSPRDAIHAAVAQTNQLEGIVSTDKHFDVIDTLKRLDPLALYPERE